MRIRFAIAFAVGILMNQTVAVPARADDRGELELATSRFRAADYQSAVTILERLLSRPLEPNAANYKPLLQLFREARPTYAACLIWLGQVQEADAVILSHLRDNPFYELPAGAFHQKVVERVIKVRAAHRADLEVRKKAIQAAKQQDLADAQRARDLDKARLKRLEALASKEKLVTERSRLVAMIPFGVGQFQNDDTGLGVFFALSETLAVGSSIVTAVVAQRFVDICSSKHPVDPSTGQAVDCPSLAVSYETTRTVNWISVASFATLAVAGIIEAQVSLVPETVTVRPRTEKRGVKVEPVVGWGPAGSVVGLRGRF